MHDGEVFGSEPGPSLLDLLDQGNLRQAGERIIGSPIERIPYAEATLRAPLEPRSLRDCVAFLQHLRNLSRAADMPVDDRHAQFPPFYFSNPAAVIGPYDDARMFFALPASRGFLLAGGAALLAQHLTARPTEDLDFFTAPERGHVPAARDALEAAARQRGWITERIHDSDTFCRMVIRSADSGVLIDLAVNAPPDLPASATPAGPTLAPEELAGNKLLARAAQIDPGFDVRVLADMIATLDRFTDSEIPVPDGSPAAELRAFYAAWRSELTA